MAKKRSRKAAAPAKKPVKSKKDIWYNLLIIAIGILILAEPALVAYIIGILLIVRGAIELFK